MGGYASFPLCIAASILKIKYVIYENNLIMGKANKILLPFAKKILVAKGGGCSLGIRDINYHLSGFRSLNANHS